MFVARVAGAFLTPLLSSTAHATSTDYVYRGVKAIYLHVWIASDPKFRKLIPVDSILKEANAHLARSLRGPRPDIDVIYKRPGSTILPEKAQQFGTLSVLIQITVREWTGTEPSFDGYLVSVGLRLRNKLKGRDVDQLGLGALGVEPLVATKKPDVLAERILDVLRSKLDVEVVDQLRYTGPY